jgi:hypothetical protein
MNTATKHIAQAYLPLVTRRFGAILNLEVKVNRAEEGSAVYTKDANPPEGATPTSWLLYTDAAVGAYRKVGAVVVSA